MKNACISGDYAGFCVTASSPPSNRCASEVAVGEKATDENVWERMLRVRMLQLRIL